MRHYVKPTIEQNPDIIILHCGTNNLKINQDESTIAKNILDVALEITKTSKKTNVIVSSLVTRNDKFGEKANEVNVVLSTLCQERNVGFINNDNLSKAHLNKSRLHLNRKGSSLLARNFKELVSN